ncbi:MAG: outer membrane beta-barrel protein [Kiritimatiellae bacterium]|nr:outer membrane beta-barrel protein [Kiritimatiellia bacterium]
MKTSLFASALLLSAAVAFAAEGTSPVHVANRIRAEYDSNVYQAAEDEKDSLNIYEEIELSLNLVGETSFLGLRYRPNVICYTARDDHKTDLYHDLDVNLSQQFGPTVTFGLSDQLRAGQLPAVEDDDYRVRSDDDNIYNSLLATLAIQLQPSTRLDLSGRYRFLKYGEDEGHESDNYRAWVAGASLRQVLGSLTTVAVDYRYQDFTYNDAPKGSERDNTTHYIGGTIERTFSPELLGSLRAGASIRSFELDAYDDDTSPYVDLSLSLLPSPRTRLTANVGYSVSESEVSYYMTENRLYASLHLAHELTKKLSLYASAGCELNKYDDKYLVGESQGDLDDKDSSYYASARLSFQVLRNNWLEIGYQFTGIDSDLRTEYDRHRVNAGWRWQLF